MKNLFVLAADPHNMSWVEPLAGQLGCRFHRVLSFDDVQSETHSPFTEPLERAIAELDAFAGSIDGIMGYWDFPVSTMLPILQARYGCPGPSLESVLACEHKYWSRLIQAEVAPAHVPDFRAVDPFDSSTVSKLREHPGFPLWIKPIKAHSSQLGFYIENKDDLRHALDIIRRGLARFGGPFDEALAHVEHLPRPELSGVSGGHCLAEGIVEGWQCTLEGYVHRGEVTIPTIVDSLRIAGGSSFSRYQYPSKLPARIKSRMREIATKVILHHGLDESCFNVEMYWDEDQDQLWLLEINPRASQSHTVITAMVDGLPHLEAMAALALGQTPAPHVHGRGDHEVAAKCFLRVARDAWVERVPSEQEIAALEREHGCHIQIDAKAGRRLSQIVNQDSYTFAIAKIHLGAASEEELEQSYRQLIDSLHFEFRGDVEFLAATGS